MQRTGMASTATQQQDATITSMTGLSGSSGPDALSDNTMHIIGHSGMSSKHG